MRTIPDSTPSPQLDPLIARLERELAVIAAHEAERLRRIVDPWDVLAHARRYDHLRARAKAYPKFIALTAAWPAADVDMLVAEARKVFRVRIGVMRADLARAQAGAR